MSAPQFFQHVREVVGRIPRGHVATYGAIAAACGNPHAARQVGWALFVGGPSAIPWHRVVAAQGYITIRNPEVTAETQKELLEREGIPVAWDDAKKMYKIVNFSQIFWKLT